MTSKQLDDIKSSRLKELEVSRPKKREPLNVPPDKADSFRRKINMQKKYYIAYGSNLNHAQMAYRCPDAELPILYPAETALYL